jgi:hypothetical protein
MRRFSLSALWLATVLAGVASQGCKTDASCQAAPECAELGACMGKLFLFRCNVGSDADCKRSETCKREGNCKAIEWEDGKYLDCGPGSDLDCLQSEYCKKDGFCRRDPKGALDKYPKCVLDPALKPTH